MNEFVAVNPERMEKAGIKVLDSEKKKKVEIKSKAKVTLNPNVKVTLNPNARATLSPNAKSGVKKISPNAKGSKFPVKKGPSPNKGLAAKKPLIKK